MYHNISFSGGLRVLCRISAFPRTAVFSDVLGICWSHSQLGGYSHECFYHHRDHFSLWNILSSLLSAPGISRISYSFLLMLLLLFYSSCHLGLSPLPLSVPCPLPRCPFGWQVLASFTCIFLDLEIPQDRSSVILNQPSRLLVEYDYWWLVSKVDTIYGHILYF